MMLISGNVVRLSITLIYLLVAVCMSMKDFFFKFACPICGEYSVDEKTFRVFITPKLNGILDERLSVGDVTEAVNEFDRFCPRCCPNSDMKVTLTVRRLKDVQL
jgi:hypothetical protein